MATQWDRSEELEDEDGEQWDRPSKSQIKRELDALQDLGKEMTGLGTETLNRIPLPEDVRDAIDEYAKMRSFGAQRRQLQLIGKLMRNLDYNLVRQAIDLATGESRAAVAAHHSAERLRDRLLTDKEFLTGFIAQYPAVDVQTLRRLIRSAQKEQSENKPPKSARELYRLLHALVAPQITDLYKKEDDSSEENA